LYKKRGVAVLAGGEVYYYKIVKLYKESSKVFIISIIFWLSNT